MSDNDESLIEDVPATRDDTSSKVATPSISFVSDKLRRDVYPPSEDTYLMMDALEKDYDVLRSQQRGRPIAVAEFGTGSGSIITFLRNLLEQQDDSEEGTQSQASIPVFYIAVDINEIALREVARPVFQHDCNAPSCSNSANKPIGKNVTNTQSANRADFILTDLMGSFHKHKNGFLDLVIFNPPYVETPMEEVYHKDIIYRSWAGGPRGRVVLDRFLEQLPLHLNRKRFILYLVLTQENDPTEVSTILKNMFQSHDNDDNEYPDIKTSIVLRQKPGFENLVILRASCGVQFDN